MDERPVIAIAYLSETGRGFSPVEPYLAEDVDDLDDALRKKAEMEKRGLKGIKVFAYDPTKKPDYITWSFVKAHLVQQNTTS